MQNRIGGDNLWQSEISPLRKAKKDKKANNLEEIAVEQDVNAAAAAQKMLHKRKKEIVKSKNRRNAFS